MKYAQHDLERNQITKFKVDETFDASELIEENGRILTVSPFQIVGEGSYEKTTGLVQMDIEIMGVITTPCAISLKPVEIDIRIRYAEDFAFDFEIANESQAMYVENGVIDLEPLILDAIAAEVPLKVVHPDVSSYPKGEGWVVYDEESYEDSKKDEIDPRLAILKDYKVE